MDYDRAVHLLLSDKCPSRTRAIMAAFIVNVFVDNVHRQSLCKEASVKHRNTNDKHQTAEHHWKTMLRVYPPPRHQAKNT